MFVLCLSMTASHVTRGPGHSHSKQAPWGRLKPSTAHEKGRRPSTFLVRKRAPPWELGASTGQRKGPRAVCIRVQNHPGPCSLPSSQQQQPLEGREARAGRLLRDKSVPSSPSICFLSRAGSIYSTMLGKGGKEGEQASLWPLNPVTPALCFPDKVLPAPGMLFLPLPDPHKTRAVP